MSIILAFKSNPVDLLPLMNGTELRNIQNRISGVIGYDYQIETVESTKKSDIQSNIHRLKPAIIHFTGHGNGNGEIIFENSEGESSSASVDGLKSVFSSIKHDLKCVLLNLCYAKKQADAISLYASCVIGMKSKIPDALANLFAQEFYTALAEEYSVLDAYNRGCAEMKLEKAKPSQLPDLVCRHNVNPESIFVNFKVKLMAKFEMARNKISMEDDENYDMILWLENLPKDISSVIYNYNDEEFTDPFEEITSWKEKFKTTLSSYGNLEIRVMLWKTNGSGIGISCSLTDALTNFYGNTDDRLIKRAIAEISGN